jgi:CheY-like chemotaxis protein
VRILLVEDDDLVREVTAEMLEEAGHEVLLAASAPEAERIAANTPVIDVLITDIIMPGGNGVDLARSLARRRSGMKTLFTTGYTRHIAPELTDAPILDKPYHRDALLHALGRLIGFETA